MIASLEKLVQTQVDRSDLPNWSSRLRRESLEQFKNVGFPHRRQEAWKYTSTRSIVENEFSYARATPLGFQSEAVQSQLNADHLQLIFVDGVLCPESSALQSNTKGLRIQSMHDVLHHGDQFFAPMSENLDPFALLNLASCEHGCVIDLQDKVELAKPIEIVFLRSSEDYKPLIVPRVQLKLGRFSSLTLLEKYASSGEREFFLNQAVQLSLGDGASCRHFRVMDEGRKAWHLHNLDVLLGRDARYESLSTVLSSGWVRSNQNIRLQESGASAVLDAIYVPAEGQHVDFCTVIDHQVAHTNSSQLYKGIVQKGGRAVFNGLIKIAKGADHSHAAQLNNNLAFDDDFEIDTRPQMEIDADDVRCSHGATVGQMEADQLFYLQSRGIPPEQGRRLLAGAFVNEVLLKHAGILSPAFWRDQILTTLDV